METPKNNPIYVLELELKEICYKIWMSIEIFPAIKQGGGRDFIDHHRIFIWGFCCFVYTLYNKQQ